MDRDISDKHTANRITEGLGGQKEVIQRLKSAGYGWQDATLGEDRYEGIDGHIQIESEFQSTQIKCSDRGLEIQYEVYKDYCEKKLGRDYARCTAELYIYRDRDNRIWLSKTADLKLLTDAHLQRADALFKVHGNRRTVDFNVRYPDYWFLLRSGNGDERHLFKLMGYFQTESFASLLLDSNE